MLASTNKDLRAFIIPRFLPAKLSKRRKTIRDETWTLLLEDENRQRQAHAARLVSYLNDKTSPRLPTLQLPCHCCLKLLPFFHFQYTENPTPKNHITSKRSRPLPRKCILCRINNRFFVDLTGSRTGRSIQLSTFFQYKVFTVCVYCKNAYYKSSRCDTLFSDAQQRQRVKPQELPARHYCPAALKAQEEHDWEEGDPLRRDAAMGSAYAGSPKNGKGAMCLQSCCRDRYKPASSHTQSDVERYTQRKNEEMSLRSILGYMDILMEKLSYVEFQPNFVQVNRGLLHELLALDAPLPLPAGMIVYNIYCRRPALCNRIKVMLDEDEDKLEVDSEIVAGDLDVEMLWHLALKYVLCKVSSDESVRQLG